MKRLLVVLAVCLATGLAMLATAAVATARTIPRGIVIPDPWSMTPEDRKEALAEVKEDLRAGWVRFEVHWNKAEPTAQGQYVDSYLAQIRDTCQMAEGMGLKVILTVYGVPKWASQSDLWHDPPTSGYKVDAYAPLYLPQAKYLATNGDYAALYDFMKRLATDCGDSVRIYECWNEPNLWMFLYPQQHDGKKNYAARRYVKILKAFKKAVDDSGSAALVAGGALGPYGPNNTGRTSPQRFASQIKALGAARYMNVLSDHPYQAGGSHVRAPNRMPIWPDNAIALANLNTLLKMFPGKDVYLTEYGYNTKACPGMGTLGVGNVRQATYLRQAYTYAARYSRVKLLMWYLLEDEAVTGGWSTGLKTTAKTKKQSWYAFSRASKLALTSSTARIRRGGKARLKGRLTWIDRNGVRQPLAGKPVLVQRKVRGVWKTVKTLRSSADGRCSIAVRPTTSAVYRFTWNGVLSSRTRVVNVR